MRKRVNESGSEVRLFNLDQAAAYVGLGRTNTREFMDEIGATIKYGKRVVFDRQVIDEAISKKMIGVG